MTTREKVIDRPLARLVAVGAVSEADADEAYIALAEKLDTNVWTVDGPLAHNAEQTGLPIKLVESQTRSG